MNSSIRGGWFYYLRSRWRNGSGASFYCKRKRLRRYGHVVTRPWFEGPNENDCRIAYEKLANQVDTIAIRTIVFYH